MKNIALLMIDFQRDFCDPGGYCETIFGNIDWAQKIIPNAQRLLEAARRAGILIIHTRAGYAPDLSDCPAFIRQRYRRAGTEPGSANALGNFLVRGAYGHDFTDRLQPQAGEIVLDKTTFGAFCGTNLEEILREHRIEELALAGLTADICVHSTLREAVDRSFYCYYVADATAAADPEIETACIKMTMSEGGLLGDLTTVDEMIKKWQVSF